METITYDLVCKICNIKYKYRSGLWKHNRKFHNTDNTDNTDNTVDNNNIKKYICSKCNKQFNNYQNRWKHLKICLYENIDLIKENKELKNTIKQQSQEITKIKEILTDLMNKNCKVHPNT